MNYGKIIFYFMKVNLIFIFTFEEYDITIYKEFQYMLIVTYQILYGEYL